MRYEIKGEPLPVVIVYLEAGESIKCEKGAMSWMTPNMKMETTSNGGIGKALGRMLAGESIFQNRYTAEGGEGMIAFASSFPGTILPVEITPDRPVIVQKSAFLAGVESVDISLFLQKKLGAGFFGGEGFIMQKLSGEGIVFVEIDGSTVEYDLAPGQQMIVDTGYLAMMDGTCSMDITAVKGAKNMFFGGEGAFNTVITGPGKIVLQTMPVNSVAGALIPFMPSGN